MTNKSIRDYIKLVEEAQQVVEQPAPKSLGTFLYYALTRNLRDINIPYEEGTPEFDEFVDAYGHAYLSQDRRLLRMSMDPVRLASFLNIPNYEMYMSNAVKGKNS